MFLSTLREIIINKPECLKNYINTLMPLYFAQSNSEDEPIRNIVSESIGKLFITHPDEIKGPLEQALLSQNIMTVSTVARSFKFSAHNNTNPHHFNSFVNILIQLVKQNDLAVKKNSLQSLNQIVYNNNLKSCVKDHVEEIVQVCLNEATIKKELIITVDLGPFKHTVDNGAAIRKAAFNLMETLAEQFSFNQSQVIDAVVVGILDTNEDV